MYEKIFDNLVIQDLFKLKTKGIYESFIRIINEGKESKVLLVKDKEGVLKAIKIYKVEASNFKKMWYYIEGDERFKKVGKGKRDIVYAWCKKEYHNLELAYEAGVKVPKPYYFIRNIVVMEFIGSKEGIEAPQLRKVILKDPEAFFQKIIENVRKLLKNAKLVHADLSEFNIVMYKEEPYLLDMGQAVLTSHPRAKEFFERDINNIAQYFKKNYELEINTESLKRQIGRGVFYV